MGISVELKKSSRKQSNSKPVLQRVLLPPANQVSRQQDRSTVQNYSDPLYSNNPRCEIARETAKSSVIHYRQSKKSHAVEDSELVKHMTNLPGYLKRVDKAENFQDKVLNVGVLDWSRLEQWKHTQKNVLEKGSSSASCSSSNSVLKKSSGSSRSSSLVHTSRLSEQHSSLRSSLIPSRKRGLSQNIECSVQTAIRLQDRATPSRSIVLEQKNASQSCKSVNRSHSGVISEKEKIKGMDQKMIFGMRRASAEHKSLGTSHHPKENSSFKDVVTKKAIEVPQETNTKTKNVDQSICSEVQATSSKLGDCDVSLSLTEKKIARSVRTRSRFQDLKQSDIGLANQGLPEQGNRIVLLLPKELPEKGFSEVSKISRHRPSFDKPMTASWESSFSNNVSPKDITCVKNNSEIPHSGLPSSSVDTNINSDKMKNGVTTDYRTLLSSTSRTLPFSEKKRDLHPEREYMVKSRSDNKLQNSKVIDPVEKSNREDTGLTGSNSRNPSPLRRFSFSLGRMGRSLSFKEGTAVPQLSSTHVSVRSGPLSSDASNCVDNSNKEKVKAHERARSSPLRRLLNPILKHKEENPLPHHSDHHLPPKPISSSFSSGPVYTFPDEKFQESRVQALLQLKVNNGIPLFKFVVNNNSNILAATMKSLGSSGKDDSGRSYTFYLVNEIKKKSGGWLSQGSKVKSCGYAYNVVGQMKVSVSDSSDTSGLDSNQYTVRESVLFGVERKVTDQGSPKFIPNRELAAAVVRTHSKDLIEDENQSDDESMDKQYFPESKCSNCVTVILPGGVHSAPNKGEPSPLIYRWRSGGSCDCGGWDVGCQLQVLSDQNKCAGSKAFKDGRILDSFELFVQGSEQNGSVFSLVPSKDGIYSVEYSASISRLQAFFVCVAMLSPKLHHLPSVRNVSESKTSNQADLNADHELQTKFPAKYAPIPPLSPVGRV